MSRDYDQSGIGPNVELGKRGPRVKNNSNVVELRNQADDDFAVLRAGTPVGDDDVVTKGYLETRADIAVTGQINGGSPPAVGTLGTIYLCTTSGGVYTEGYLYRSDGSSWVELVPTTGLKVSVTVALSGGNIEFTADHIYLWDEEGGSWVDVGPAPQGTAIVKTARATLVHTDTGENAVVTVPANAIITKVLVNITQIWDGSNVTLEIGDASDPDRLLATAANDLAKLGVCKVDLAHLYGSQTVVNATITNNGDTPSQGQALVVVHYDIV